MSTIIDQAVKIKMYKCFGLDEQGFDKLYPINVIIGKNNSGKSSLIDLINFVIDASSENIRRKEAQTKIICSTRVTKDLIEKSFPVNVAQGRIHSKFPLAEKHIGHSITFEIDPTSNYAAKIIGWTPASSNTTQFENEMGSNISILIREYKVFNITAERDILSEKPAYATDSHVMANGQGATNLIWQVVSSDRFGQNFVREDLLKELNKITCPDISFSAITTKQREDGKVEIYLTDSFEREIPISKMGSGVKTILLVLINLILTPLVKGVGVPKGVFCFEELENNLHPSMFRRLLAYIADYAQANDSYFFITTHSSIAVDLFRSNSHAQILHIKSEGKYSSVRSVINNDGNRAILRDLDYKASDLLLSNGVIWVEGPSDVLYVTMLLELYAISGQGAELHKFSYTIQALSTALWKYAGFKDFNWEAIKDELENKLVSLADINYNHVLIIDNDGNYEDKKPSEWANFTHGTGKNKARLIYESMKFANFEESTLENNFGDSIDGKLLFWINDDTLESYLEHFIADMGKDKFGKYLGRGSKGHLEKLRTGENSSISKMELANNIASFSRENDLQFEDFAPTGSSLYKKIARLYNTIRGWN